MVFPIIDPIIGATLSNTKQTKKDFQFLCTSMSLALLYKNSTEVHTNTNRSQSVHYKEVRKQLP